MRHASAPPLAVFDLDGTLADTAADLIATLNVVLGEEGAPPLAREAARDLLGAGVRALVQRGLAVSGRQVDAAGMERLYDRFLTHYRAHIADESELFPGVVAALDELEAAGWRLAVCTNKLEDLAVDVLKALGVADRFAAICGQNTFREADGRPIPKPDPRALLMTIERAGGTPAGAVMVGDSKADIDVARAAGVPVVAVDFGYTPVPVRELAPDAAISHFDELVAAILSVRRLAA